MVMRQRWVVSTRWSGIVVRAVLIVLAISLSLGYEAYARPRSVGVFVVRVVGLPPGARPAVTIRGPGGTRVLATQTVRLTQLKPGRYLITIRR